MKSEVTVSKSIPLTDSTFSKANSLRKGLRLSWEEVFCIAIKQLDTIGKDFGQK